MATVRFNLKSPKKHKSLILMIYTFGYYEEPNFIENEPGHSQDLKRNYKVFRYSTGVNVHTDLWNSETQRIDVPKDLSEIDKKTLRKKNNSLDSMELAIKEVAEDIKGQITPELLRAGMDQRYRQVERIPTKQYDDNLNIPESARHFFSDWIKHYTPKLSGISAVTKRDYINTSNIIRYYEQLRGKRLLFSDIDIDFYNDFVLWMQGKNGVNKRLKDEGEIVFEYCPNAVGKIIKNIKVFMNHANELGVTHHVGHKSRNFKVLKSEVDDIYLTEKEVRTIFELDLSESLHLDRARDIFLIGCYLGFRDSDLRKLDKYDITKLKINGIEKKAIRFRTQKTNKVTVIPFVFPELDEILEKYDGFPRCPSNQELNRSLKIVGKKAQLTEIIRIPENHGDKKSIVTYRKYELITMHTARRSFITNLFLRGISPTAIMGMGTHRSESSFRRYLKMSAEENASLVAEQFNKQSPLRAVK